MRLALAVGLIAITLSAAVYVHLRTAGTYIASGSCTTRGAGDLVQTVPDDEANCAAKSGTWTPTVLFDRTAKPAWEDPVAVLLVLGGISVAAGILTVRRRGHLAG